MGLITKEVEVLLNSNNIKWYEDKGISIPRREDKYGRIKIKKGTKILVKIEDLSLGSGVKIDVKCDGCGKVVKNIRYVSYIQSAKEDGKYYCQKCARNGFEKWTSFYEWCYENLSKKEADEIMFRWDYELNRRSPKDVGYGSSGIGGKGYWFKCPKNIKHEKELKRISGFTSFHDSLSCTTCNSFGQRLLDIYGEDAMETCWSNKNILNPFKLPKYSGKLVWLKCPLCQKEKHLAPKTFKKTKLICSNCGDGFSYPEKFLNNLLLQLGFDFITQLNKKQLKWCNKYKYDFYFEYNSESYIIETHGAQHYEKSHGHWEVLEHEQENDRLKKELALKNGVDHYIIIDCRESTLKFIKLNIVNSKVNDLIKFKKANIDWSKCHQFACSSRVKEACDLWNSGIKSTTQISNTMKLSVQTIIKYLKLGAEIEWCDYDPNNRREIPVICLNTLQEFQSIKEAGQHFKINVGCIGQCCRGVLKTAGKECLRWMYLDEYRKEYQTIETENDILKIS